LIGTLELLSRSEQDRVIGFVINRFRGDIALLQSGLDWLEERTGKPVLAVLPYLHGLHIEAEDAIATEQNGQGRFNVAVPVLPRISNHTDFDPLRLHPDVNLTFVGPDQEIPPSDLVILPGSKSVARDLEWLKQQGWDTYLNRHLRYGGKLMGICGGFQMLGNTIQDPDKIEGPIQSIDGLRLLNMHTVLKPNKQLRRRTGRLLLGETPVLVDGYEIHCGESFGEALKDPLIVWDDQLTQNEFEGAVSFDNQIIGTYLHGLFEQPKALESILVWAGCVGEISEFNYQAIKDNDIERLTDALEAALDTAKLKKALTRFFNTREVAQ
jgi:adenosylcobyric acid synthase